MTRRPLSFLIGFTMFLSAEVTAAVPTAQVMVVGVFHMSNPGHDLHDKKVDDVLAPKRQAEIQKVAASLNRFHPNKVMVEWDAPVVAERYPKYLAGTLEPSHNEVVQLGFRLAKMAGNKPVYGIDADADMPYEAMINYAKSHGQGGIWDDINASVAKDVARSGAILRDDGIAAELRYLNRPERLKVDNSWYRDVLKIGEGSEQPGVNLLSAWVTRNFKICANLVQLAKPGDRIVVFYGSGHAYLLRQCVMESTGFELIDPAQYLPK